jgi:hypothetical protein
VVVEIKKASQNFAAADMAMSAALALYGVLWSKRFESGVNKSSPGKYAFLPFLGNYVILSKKPINN